MKTMKMIDLLVKIANREEVPRTILYRGETYTKYQNFNGTYYYKSISRKSILLLEQIRNSSDLLYEVGIIEEDKKIEKITVREKTLGFPNGEWTARNMDKAFAIKINELIDEINNLKDND